MLIVENLHKSFATAQGNLAVLRIMNREKASAISLQRDLTDRYVRKLGSEHPVTLQARSTLATMMVDAGDAAAALQRAPHTLEDFMAQIQALSAEQVKTAMAKHLSPEAMLIVSAGPTVAQQPLPPPTERPTAQPTGVPEH